MTPDQQQAAREAFEAWYCVTAFDYATNPIGSRECGLQWKAYHAATERMQDRVDQLQAAIDELVAAHSIGVGSVEQMDALDARLDAAWAVARQLSEGSKC